MVIALLVNPKLSICSEKLLHSLLYRILEKLLLYRIVEKLLLYRIVEKMLL